MPEAAYLVLYRSGELARRAAALEARLAACDICPRHCGTDRRKDATGFCRAGESPLVASVCAHHGEEPAISGSRGSGTIFFGHCNLACVYCQNYQISQPATDAPLAALTTAQLAGKMLYLQNELGCHNINLVSPSSWVPQVVRTLLEAVPRGLTIPLVYNSNGYDSVDTLRQLDGIVDIYLPDLRYADDRWAERFSGVRDYVARARAAIAEMYRQVGDLKTDADGIARHGLVVRHLILPNDISGSRASLRWIAKYLSPQVTLSVMAQYSPQYRAVEFPELARRITRKEYQNVVALLEELGLDNGWVQQREAADCYLPDFAKEDRPFES